MARNGNKTGVVRYVGPVDFSSGTWVGVELDHAEGRNSGTIDGKTYFSCAPLHGVFVKPSNIVPEDSLSITDTDPASECDVASTTPDCDPRMVTSEDPLAAHRVYIDDLLETMRLEMLMMAKFEALGPTKRTKRDMAEYFTAARKHIADRQDLTKHFLETLNKLERNSTG